MRPLIHEKKQLYPNSIAKIDLLVVTPRFQLMTLLVGKKTNLSKFGHPFALLPIAPFQLMTPPKEKKWLCPNPVT
jgi:hypothetical protein